MASDGFEDEVSTANLLAHRSGTTLATEVELSSLGLTQADFDQYSFFYFGLAIPNPSSEQLLFANDEFSVAFGSGVE